MNILAYLDRWTAGPGEELILMASSPLPGVGIDVVRLDGPDDIVPTAIGVEALGTVGVQSAVTGSYIVVDNAGPLGLTSFTFTAWILPTMPRSAHRQVIAQHRSSAGGWAVLIDHDGRLVVEVAGANGLVTLRSGSSLKSHWQLVGLIIDAAAKSLSLFYGASTGTVIRRSVGSVEYRAPEPTSTFSFGAPQTDVSRAGGDGSYNGKLARPTLYQEAATLRGDGASAALEGLDQLPIAAAWDFSNNSVGRGTFVNAPRMLLPGPEWHADAVFSSERALWDAIRLNEDAVDDLGWAPSTKLRLPPDTMSGVYAVRLQASGMTDAPTYVPFFVRAAGKRNRVAVLLPTFTYLAYANHRYASEAAFMGDYADIADRPVTLGPIDRYLSSRPPIGPSIYDQHVDGSSVVASSLRRPIPHMQPHYRWWMTGAPRHFAADLELLRWLKANAIGYDVLTDHDLDSLPDVLDGYAAVLTGSHPEYISATERDALFAYVEAGGQLAYLGGNGFYWVTERSASSPHRIEVRRRRAGEGGWEMPPGEHILSSGNEGGLWADLGCPPEQLTGVSLAGQGWKKSMPYRRMAGAAHPRATYLFEGISEATFGFGGTGGGAVGDEWDALVPGQENDAEVILLARSAAMETGFLPGERSDLGPWGDMVLKVHGAAGGRVFSASSINFLSALNGDQMLSQLLKNFVAAAVT